MKNDFSFFLADPDRKRALRLSEYGDSIVTNKNQEAVERADLVILATRPEDVTTALSNIKFRANHS